MMMSCYRISESSKDQSSSGIALAFGFRSAPIGAIEVPLALCRYDGSRLSSLKNVRVVLSFRHESQETATVVEAISRIGEPVSGLSGCSYDYVARMNFIREGAWVAGVSVEDFQGHMIARMDGYAFSVR